VPRAAARNGIPRKASGLKDVEGDEEREEEDDRIGEIGEAHREPQLDREQEDR